MHTCAICLLSEPKGEFSASQWHNKCQEGRWTVCMECAAETHCCALCKKTLPRKEFPAQMWKNRSLEGRRTLCNDCSRPKCTRSQCKTCKVCRSESCPKRTCTDAVASLNPKQLPSTTDELRNWLCFICRYLVCQNCKKEMPRKQQRARAGTTSKQLWTCGECLTVEESKSVFQKYR